MFGHAKVPDVVAEILKSLEKLAIPLKLMLSLGMDGPNVNKSILDKLNAIKRNKAISSWSYAHEVVLSMCATTVLRKDFQSMAIMLKSCV